MESEIRLDENGESIDLDGGSSLILECEVGCEELSNLKVEIDSISSLLGNSGNCFVSPQGFSICPETIYEKLHNLSSDKIGENNELAGTNTLFQLNYLIKDSLTSNFSQFGEETILGKVDKIEKNKIGNCGDQSICEIIQGNSNNLSSLQLTLNSVKAETDLIGLPTDTSSSETLFGKIAGISCEGGFNPFDPCFIKVMNRISTIIRYGFDPVTKKDLYVNTYPEYIVEIYNYINNLDWAGFCN